MATEDFPAYQGVARDCVNYRVEMCAVPLFIQKAAPKDWNGEFDCRFRKFGTCPFSDVLDKMIWMLGKPPRPKDREAGSPTGGEIGRDKRRKSIKLR